MKAAVGCLAVVALAFVLLLGLTFFVISDTEDQSGLSTEVDVTVTTSEEKRRSSSGHTVDYAYRIGAQRFVNQTWITNTGWMPGEPLSACVDPDAPERHALRTDGTEVCGDDFIAFTVETAEPAR
ncbi:hypothetical protein ASG73_11275 [Janibacter sp. Soil728]|uniref:DUF3592 domain-containing protein n=1 Tax=Janibacter sp. Soil728 TaxID=1736393 RepID=UPI0006F2B928|nr:DUF3592 domain-containing protein [Janibacter sp. Soil728]KRE36905.1 hypothetical protein ASG73_11275 [Janibacter sp. Soil728]